MSEKLNFKTNEIVEHKLTGERFIVLDMNDMKALVVNKTLVRGVDYEERLFNTGELKELDK